LFFPLIALASSPTGRAPAPTKIKSLQKEKPVVISLSAESDRRFVGGSRQAF
jgi:hypothetical protein